MNCPACGKDAVKVKDTRHDIEDSIIMRRRQCLDCSHVFFTKEIIVEYNDACYKNKWNKSDRQKSSRYRYFAKEAYKL